MAGVGGRADPWFHIIELAASLTSFCTLATHLTNSRLSTRVFSETAGGPEASRNQNHANHSAGQLERWRNFRLPKKRKALWRNNDVTNIVVKFNPNRNSLFAWPRAELHIMKLKNLRKKIRRIEKRLREGPKKLARLKEKLETMEAAKAREAQRKLRSPARVGQRPEEKASAKNVRAKRPPRKAKRKLNLSPERRAQLAAAMKARWAAKRAATGTNPKPAAENPTPQ